MKTIKSGTCAGCGIHIGTKNDMCIDCTREVMLQIEDDMRIEDKMMARL